MMCLLLEFSSVNLNPADSTSVSEEKGKRIAFPNTQEYSTTYNTD